VEAGHVTTDGVEVHVEIIDGAVVVEVEIEIEIEEAEVLVERKEDEVEVHAEVHAEMKEDEAEVLVERIEDEVEVLVEMIEERVEHPETILQKIATALIRIKFPVKVVKAHGIQTTSRLELEVTKQLEEI